MHSIQPCNNPLPPYKISGWYVILDMQEKFYIIFFLLIVFHILKLIFSSKYRQTVLCVAQFCIDAGFVLGGIFYKFFDNLFASQYRCECSPDPSFPKYVHGKVCF